IADDDAGLRTLLMKLVCRAGFEATAVCNGKDALRAISNGSFDLLLLDLQMPHMDGLQVLRELRSAGLKTAVVIVSGNHDLSTAVETMRLGAMDYIEKPFLPEYLVGVLRRCFEALLAAEKQECAPASPHWTAASKS